jgi:serine/threonine protein kinase/tetratricopeptide (TPR) repeat protein
LPEQSLEAGTIFDERYVIKAVAGRGGMATVYRAFHTGLGRDVALKILHAERIRTAEEIRRFQQEAQLVSTISHPNITSVSAFGTFDDKPYVAFEFLEGVSLDNFIQYPDAPLTFEHFVRLFRQICDGLECAHQKGIVHRDLKPANIILVNPNEEDETAKIVDFGIAKALPHVGAAQQKLTATGTVLGTPLYMSPEQSSGLGVDARSDIYALGCIMYYCLMRRPPFDGESHYEVMYMHATGAPPDAVLPTDFNPGVNTVISRCMAKSPGDRYQSVGEIRADLNALVGGKQIDAVDSSSPKRPQRRSLRQPIFYSVIVGGIIGAASVAWFSPDMRHMFYAFCLQSQWQQGNFAQTTDWVRDLYANGDQESARYLVKKAMRSAFKNPSVDAAKMFLSVVRADNRKEERQNAVSYISHIMHCLPDPQWENSSTIDPLVDAYLVALNRKTSAERLLTWARKLNSLPKETTQVVAVKRAAKLLDGKPPRAEIWKDLHGLTVLLQWQQSRLSDARSCAEVAVEIAPNTDEFSGPTAPEMKARGQLTLAGILASIPYNQQSENVLFQALENADPDSKWSRIPLLIALAEAEQFKGHDEGALDYLQRAEAECRESKAFRTGVAYLGVIGDGYTVLGKKDLANKAYNDVKQLHEKMIDAKSASDEGGPMMLANVHACLMTGDDAAAMHWFEEAKKCDTGARFRTPFERWFVVHHPMDLVVAKQIGEQYKAQPATGYAMRQKLLSALSLAAFRAYAGRYQTAAAEVRHVWQLMQEAGLDGDCGFLWVAADWESTLAGSDLLGESYCKTVLKETSVTDVKYQSAIRLSTLCIRQNRFVDARKYIEIAEGIPHQNKHQRKELYTQKLSLAYRSRNWADLVATYEQFKDDKELDSEWMRNWREMASFAMRQLGREEQADELLAALVREEQR